MAQFICRPQIEERRSQNSYTVLCNDIISHGAPIGDILVFADQTRGNNRKQNGSMIFVHHAAFHACLSSWTAVDAGDICTR